jgi:hypothetical protein
VASASHQPIKRAVVVPAGTLNTGELLDAFEAPLTVVFRSVSSPVFATEKM